MSYLLSELPFCFPDLQCRHWVILGLVGISVPFDLMMHEARHVAHTLSMAHGLVLLAFSRRGGILIWQLDRTRPKYCSGVLHSCLPIYDKRTWGVMYPKMKAKSKIRSI
jgi:hypothetical protein